MRTIGAGTIIVSLMHITLIIAATRNGDIDAMASPRASMHEHTVFLHADVAGNLVRPILFCAWRRCCVPSKNNKISQVTGA